MNKQADPGNSMIAPCGVYCKLCLGHLRKKNVCSGCWSDDDSKPYHCAVCSIKNCEYLKASGSRFCYDCEKFPCRRLKDLDKRYRTKYQTSLIENLTTIRDLGTVSFLESQHVRWRCNTCGGMMCVHTGSCITCQS